MKNDDLKPIETVYNGYKFRSRLEARWAVFFDELGIKYEYELEGFELNSGKKYLPDFWLPDFDCTGMFVEVKYVGGDLSKAIEFCKEAQKPLWLAEGTPDFKAYKYFTIWPTDDGEEISDIIFGIPNADQAEGENRMYSCPGYENEDGSIPDDYLDSLGKTFVNAVLKARQSRFEFNA